MKKTTSAAASTAVIVMLSAQAASADSISPQTPPRPASGRGIEEIVVTARRVRERLQATPIAVTAFTARSMQQRQVFNIAALQQSTPGLVVTTNHSGVGISLRGQVQASSDSSVDQSVGLYVDGIYIARQMGGRFDLVDIDRVEVLHGPQGTLFGRNTTGGAVNIITNKPTNTFGGSLDFGLGNYNRHEVTAVLNVPVSDTVQTRFVIQHKDHSGYGTDTYLHRDVADDDYTYARALISVTPNPTWSMLVSADYVDRNSNGPAIHIDATAPGSPVIPYISSNPYNSQAELAAYEHIKMADTSATITGNFGNLTLKSITGLRNLRVNTLTDFDTTPLPVFSSHATGQIDQISQEVQAIAKLGHFDLTTGVYYFDEAGNERYLIDGGALNYGSHINQESYGPYAQGTYHVNDKLRVTGGIRYTVDDRSLIARNTLLGTCFIDLNLVDNAQDCQANRSISNSYPSYTAGVDYQLSRQVFVYARTSGAHKSGGFNKSSNSLSPFAPEQVTDYEVGVKTDLLDRRLRLNAAAFVSFYKDMQRPVTSNATGVPVALIQSVGASRIPGLEIDAVAIPFSNFELDGNLSLLGPKYTNFHDATGDLTHTPFTRVSNVTFSFAGTYTIPASYGDYSLHADYGYQSHKFFFASPLTRQNGYGIVNTRFALALHHPSIELAIWSRNLTDQRYNVEDLDFLGASGVDPAFPGDPRTFGANVTYRF